jgi:uncharacterized protein involved in outer membrane biogenesis
MKKTARFLIKTFILLIFFSGVGLAIFLNTFNPNQYKNHIIQAVHQATGYQLKLAGDITLKWLPTLSLKMQQVTLSNKHASLAEIPELSIHIALLPLLEKKLDVTEIELIEPSVALISNNDNTTNWTSSALSTASSPQKATSAKSTQLSDAQWDNLSAITLKSVKITNGQLRVEDSDNKSHISALNFAASQVNILKQISYKLTANVKSQAPQRALLAKIKLDGKLQFDFPQLKQQHIAQALSTEAKLQLPLFQYNQVLIKNIVANLRYKDNKSEIQLLNSQLYSGTLAGKLNIEHTKQMLNTKLSLKSVDIGNLLFALNKTHLVKGKLSSDLTLSSKGETPRDKVQNLNGRLVLKVDDGFLNYIDLNAILSSLKSIAKQPKNLKNILLSTFKEVKQNKNYGKSSTPFDFLTAIINIKNGEAFTNNLKIHTKQLELQGGGKISLIREYLDLQLKLGANQTDSFYNSLFKNIGGYLPINIKGAMQKPKTEPDFAYLLKQAKKQWLKDQNNDISNAVNKLSKRLPKLF